MKKSFLQPSICAVGWRMQRRLLLLTGTAPKVTAPAKCMEWKTPQLQPFGHELCDLRKAPSESEHAFGGLRSLRPRQQQREQLGAAFAVDDPVDEVGPEPPLEGDHRLLRVG